MTSDTDKKAPAKPETYLGELIMKRDKEGLKKYRKWTTEHNKRLRQLEREAMGEQTPGDDYDD